MTIRAKLIGVSLAALVLVLGVGGAAVLELRRTMEATAEAEVLARASRNTLECEMMRDALRGDVLAALLAGSEGDAGGVREDVRGHVEWLRGRLRASEVLELDEPIRAALEATEGPLEDYCHAADDVVRLAGTERRGADERLAEFSAAFVRLEECLTRTSDLLQGCSEEAARAADERGQRAQLTIIGAAVAAGVILCMASLLLARDLTRALRRVAGVLTRVAQRDLAARVRLQRRDELGRLGASVDGMVEGFHGILNRVTEASAELSTGAGQIAVASQSLAAGAGEQAASLQQISAALEEMSGMTRQNAQNARQASELSAQSKASADQGQREMAQMATAMGEVRESSAQIGKVLRVIDDIAFQTNLLALNAAVEAARAGDAGRGFAVVADEVRNLARRSAEAAQSTAALLEEAAKRADAGVGQAQRVARALDDIVAGTDKVKTLVTEIAAASGQQAAGIGQINMGVNQLDHVTQRSAGNSQELASGAEEMSAQVTALRELVGQFRVGAAPEMPVAAPVPMPTPEPVAPEPAPVAVAIMPSAPLEPPPRQAAPPMPAPRQVSPAPVPAPASSVWPAPPTGSVFRGAAAGLARKAPDPERVIPMKDEDVLASF